MEDTTVWKLATVAVEFSRSILSGAGLLAAAAILAALPSQAQQPSSTPEAHVIVVGEGSVSAPPDYAQISGGVVTTAKTVKDASDANAKLMSAVTAALLDAGVAQKDIQTSRFSIQPVHASQEPRGEPKLIGFSVSNQVTVAIRQIAAVGDIIGRMVAAGATDVGNVAFLIADPSKALDQAREAAVADARRKAEIYARASGVKLGGVAWITEEPGYMPAVPMRAAAMAAAAVPISSGENTLHVRIVVGFDIVR